MNSGMGARFYHGELTMEGFPKRVYIEHMRFASLLVPFVAGILLLAGSRTASADSRRDEAPSRAWVHGAIGFGFGTGKLEGFSAQAGANAGGWVTEGFGLGALFEAQATGMPDGDGSTSLAVAPQLCGRLRFPSADGEGALMGSVGAGYTSMKATPRRGATEYADTVVVTGDLGVFLRWKFLSLWTGVVARGVPGFGLTVAPQLRLGFAF